MELTISKLRIPVEKDGIDEYVRAASQKLECGAENIRFSRMLSKSLDMSDKNQFFYDISIAVTVPDNFDNRENFPAHIEKTESDKKSNNFQNWRIQGQTSEPL